MYWGYEADLYEKKMDLYEKVREVQIVINLVFGKGMDLKFLNLERGLLMCYR